MASRRSLCCSLLLICLLALTACGAPADAGRSSPASPAPTSAGVSAPPTTPDTQATPASSRGPARNVPLPVLPEAAKQNTREGFEAFTQYWFDAITYAFETGDTTLLRSLSSEGCKMCDSYLTSVMALHGENGWRLGPRWTVKGFISDLTPDSTGRLVGDFVLEESASISYGADGSPTENRRGGRLPGAQRAYATYSADTWRMVEAGGA
ncbi:DUF6318 family protein [Sinomonas susongensis]|uniref:DUF6318 family protein n=1 Tax=Sinomonas susongensis TaxID=1324851 RepID=UPI002482BCE5|nr:DUF6318 family protein [Sinomonas susongensis]